MLHNGTVSVAGISSEMPRIVHDEWKRVGKKQLCHFKVIYEHFLESIDTKVKYLMW